MMKANDMVLVDFGRNAVGPIGYAHEDGASNVNIPSRC
jgi:hypothetical protein